MTNMTIEFHIGVKDCRFILSRPCSRHLEQKISLTVSFFLKGDFLPAAVSDDIKKTIDYDALSEHIKHLLMPFDCASFEDMKINLSSQITDFSSLIKGGYLLLSMRCHDAFRCKIHLL